MYHYFIKTESIQESMETVKANNIVKKSNKNIHYEILKIDHLIEKLEDDLQCFSMFIHVF